MRIFALTIAAALSFAAQPALAQDDWVERSNEYTRDVLEMEAVFAPEGASSSGLEQYDGLAMDLGPDLTDRYLARARATRTELQAALERETDPNIRQDLQILIQSLEEGIEGTQLSDRLMISWYNIPQAIFSNVSNLLDEQMAPERQRKAVELLQRYTGTYPDTAPIAQLAKDRFADSLGEGKVGPYRGNVEDELAKFDTYVTGVHELFERFEIDGAEDALAALDRQVADYAEWTRAEVLPVAREDYRLPPEIYAYRLKTIGIDIPPEELMSRARKGFYETRANMQALAPRVAAKFGFDKTDYPAVIKALKRDVIAQNELEAHYGSVNDKLETIVEREGIVTLPDYEMKMRLATPAETAVQPAPHMQPPRLIGNQGEQGTFVLTTSNPGAGEEAYDDFSFDAASWTLSAHEGRPGHELQFASIVDRGVSQARVLYAFNSVNVEGWALYAEAEVLPYEPIEGQLIALQHRLLRAARAFLDPMLNLGLIDLGGARRVLSDEAGFSNAMVQQELDRYTFRAPGQAGSYFYGYSRLADLRVETEALLGEQFDRKAFNDFILDQGLLPPDLIAKAVREEFIPAQMD